MTDLSWSPYHTELNDLLANLYPDLGSAYRIVDEAGMKRTAVDFDGNAINRWHKIIEEAEKQGRLSALIQQAGTNYPNINRLKELQDMLMVPRQDAIIAMQQFDLPGLGSIVDKLRQRIPNAPETWYFAFRLQFMQLEIEDAIVSLDHLLTLPIVDGDLPLKVDQLKEIQATLHYWKAALMLKPDDPRAPIEVSMLVGQDEEHQKEAQRDRLSLGEAEFDVPQIEHKAYTRFSVVNQGDDTAHVYFVKAMPDGQLHVGALLTGPEMFDGVGAGQRGLGPVFPAVDTPSVIEIRLFCSPRRIDKMLTPVTPAVQQLEGAWISEEDVQGVSMMRFWFQVTKVI